MTHLKDTLLAHIKNGQLDMKPKWHFAMRSVSYASGLLLMGLVGLYFLSLVLFTLRESGLWWTPGFGFRGLLFFVTTSPWLLIAVTFVFLGSLYILIRHFGHNYRHRAIYSLLGLVLFALLGTSLMHYLAIQEGMRNWTKNHPVPGLTPLYQMGLGRHSADITPGHVMTITPDGFSIENRDGRYYVQLSKNTRSPRGFSPRPGDQVMVFGPHVGSSTINAEGIRPLPPPLEKRLKHSGRE